MNNILIQEHNDSILEHLSDYFSENIQSYKKTHLASIVGMILHKDNCYFTINLQKPYLGYSNYTPLILFKRDYDTNFFVYDDGHRVPYSQERLKFKDWDEANRQEQIDHPLVLHSVGCGSGSKGWVFKTQEEAFSFISEITEMTKTFSNDFESFYEFIDMFDKDQRNYN